MSNEIIECVNLSEGNLGNVNVGEYIKLTKL